MKYLFLIVLLFFNFGDTYSQFQTSEFNIPGILFDDYNLNSIQEPNEPGLNNIGVVINGNFNYFGILIQNYLDYTITDSLGMFNFKINIPPMTTGLSFSYTLLFNGIPSNFTLRTFSGIDSTGTGTGITSLSDLGTPPAPVSYGFTPITREWKSDASNSNWLDPNNWVRSIPDYRLVAVIDSSDNIPEVLNDARLKGLIVNQPASIIIKDSLRIEIIDTLVNNGFIQVGNNHSQIIFKGDTLQIGYIEPGQSTFILDSNKDVHLISNNSSLYNFSILDSTNLDVSGKLNIRNQLFLNKKLNMLTDTLNIENGSSDAIKGDGIITGIIKRNIITGSLEPYRFESTDSYIKFDGTGTYPNTISITLFADTNLFNSNINWEEVSSTVDTVKNIISTDNVNKFSRWIIKKPKEKTQSSFVNRAYSIVTNLLGNINDFNARLSLHYDQSEVPIGMDESDLTLGRIDEVTGIDNNRIFPEKYRLYQNYPNPFNPSTIIKFYIPIESNVILKVYNLLGQEVRVLINNKQYKVGEHKYEFQARALSSGIYFYSFRANEYFNVKKFILLR